MAYFSHPSAIIDPGASIGDESKIWHFCHIMASAKIGQQCVLGQNVFVGSNVVLGNMVKVQNNVSIYTGVQCEDEVFLGPSMVFTNVINPRSNVERKEEFKPTLVQHGASIGANATILCGVKIGRYAMIAAGAVVTKDVSDYQIIAGNPARHHGWISRNGQTLKFENGQAICPQTQERYQLVNEQVSLISE